MSAAASRAGTPLAERPLCADASRDDGEPLAATASRIEHWLLVEYAGVWPHDPLDAAVFAGALREHLAAQLGSLPHSRLLLTKTPSRADRDGGVRVVYGRTAERAQRFFRVDLERHADLLELDLASALRPGGRDVGERLDHPLLLVCTHGKRDRCCARYGRALCEALHAAAPPGWVVQATHVGGDRFAGNLVCLPEGLYFGRVGRGNAAAVLTAYLEGRIELECYRGRSHHPFPIQAAELEVRRRTGLTGFADLRVAEARGTAPARWHVGLLAEVAGELHRVEVRRELSPPRFVTCRAEEARRPPRFLAV